MAGNNTPAQGENIDYTPFFNGLDDGGLRDIAALAASGLVSQEVMSRAALFSASGGYGDRRDLYDVLGYERNPSFASYLRYYERGDIAEAVVTAYPDESWRLFPRITEDGDGTDNTDFEKRWSDISREMKVFFYLHKIDVLSGIGQFGALWLGFDDGKDPKEPLKEGRGNLIFIRPFRQDCIHFEQYDRDQSSPRYGLPEIYRFDITAPVSGISDLSSSIASFSVRVHHSRVIHVAEKTTTNDLIGTPRLKPPLNRLYSLSIISGGSGEMYWRGAFPGYAFKVGSDVQKDNSNSEEVKAHMTSFVHQLQRYIRLKGIDVQQFSVQVADPTKHAYLQIALIAATAKIPQRILIGSERGELASSQDEINWAKNVSARQRRYVEPVILRPFIDKLIFAGTLPAPKGGYTVVWPDLIQYTPKDMADTENTRTAALYSYFRVPEAQIDFPFEAFLRYIMGFSDDQIRRIQALSEEARLEDRSEPTEEEMLPDDGMPQAAPETPEETEEVPDAVPDERDENASG